MYCRKCGSYLPDNVQYCGICGTPLPAVTQKKKNSNGILIAVGACALVVLLIATVLLFRAPDSRPVVIHTGRDPAPTSQDAPQPPENGWYDYRGNTYYYENGKKLTGPQEIDSEIYYFYSDGSMAYDTEIDEDGYKLELGRDGRATGATIDEVGSEWSEDTFNYGNNGSCYYRILNMEVTDCDRAVLYLEAEGQYNASVSGTWKFYVRSNGSWQYIQDFQFTQPSGEFAIQFDHPMDFDAIAAHPTVQGNASYSSFFTLCNVHMGL